jgi:hypothetical protein
VGFDSPLPIIGLKFEYAWTVENAAARASRDEALGAVRRLMARSSEWFAARLTNLHGRSC